MDIQTKPVEVERPTKATLPAPQPIDIQPIEWNVITPERVPEGEWVYFALTPEQYETLSRNVAEILRWVKEAQWRLDYYGEVDEP